VKLNSSLNCHMDVATAEGRKASYSPASNSPMPCEGRSPSSMAAVDTENAQFAGQPFWGCGRYPKCTGILKIS
jgi:hypothetical protein